MRVDLQNRAVLALRQMYDCITRGGTPEQWDSAVEGILDTVDLIDSEAEAGAQEQPRFDGAVYDPLLDDGRLGRQIGRVFEAMRDGAWRTLDEIARITSDPAASVSAQLRHLRKPRFGSYTVHLRSRGDRSVGLFEYQLLSPSGRVIGQEQ